MLSDHEFLARVGDYFDADELAEILKTDIWDFIDYFEDEILNKREALLKYMEVEEDDDTED